MFPSQTFSTGNKTMETSSSFLSTPSPPSRVDRLISANPYQTERKCVCITHSTPRLPSYSIHYCGNKQTKNTFSRNSQMKTYRVLVWACNNTNWDRPTFICALVSYWKFSNVYLSDLLWRILKSRAPRLLRWDNSSSMMSLGMLTFLPRSIPSTSVKQ